MAYFVLNPRITRSPCRVPTEELREVNLENVASCYKLLVAVKYVTSLVDFSFPSVFAFSSSPS